MHIQYAGVQVTKKVTTTSSSSEWMPNGANTWRAGQVGALRRQWCKGSPRKMTPKDRGFLQRQILQEYSKLIFSQVLGDANYFRVLWGLWGFVFFSSSLIQSAPFPAWNYLYKAGVNLKIACEGPVSAQCGWRGMVCVSNQKSFSC